MTVSPAFLEFTHEGLLLAFGFFHIMEHVGHVLVFLELLDQLLDRLALLGRHFLRIERNALELTADQIVAVILDVFLNRAVGLERAVYDDLLAVGEHFVHPSSRSIPSCLVILKTHL